MTVTYSYQVATSQFSTFAKLLFRWRGSLYKLIWKEMIIFFGLYALISLVYRFWLSGDDKIYFEKLTSFCEKATNYIPLTFVLGFYVSIVVKRWWDMFLSIPCPDKLALLVSVYIVGSDDRGKLLRRTVMRYVNLAMVLGLRSVSSAVFKRFPSNDHLVEAGIITADELKLYEKSESDTSLYTKHWLPCQWAATLLAKAKREARIETDNSLFRLIEEVNNIRSQILLMTNYDWISVPLVYTQVVTIAVYSFFTICLLGRQYLDPSRKIPQSEVDLIFPFFTLLQFLFYMGWLKVAESLINPFGEDDDDFEVNFIVERNLQVSYQMVDDLCDVLPPLQQDLHWGVQNIELPHTAASLGLKDEAIVSSTQQIELSAHDSEIVVPLSSTLNSVAEETKNSPMPSRTESIAKLWEKLNRQSLDPIDEEQQQQLQLQQERSTAEQRSSRNSRASIVSLSASVLSNSAKRKGYYTRPVRSRVHSIECRPHKPKSSPGGWSISQSSSRTSSALSSPNIDESRSGSICQKLTSKNKERAPNNNNDWLLDIPTPTQLQQPISIPSINFDQPDIQKQSPSLARHRDSKQLISMPKLSTVEESQTDSARANDADYRAQQRAALSAFTVVVSTI